MIKKISFCFFSVLIRAFGVYPSTANVKNNVLIQKHDRNDPMFSDDLRTFSYCEECSTHEYKYRRTAEPQEFANRWLWYRQAGVRADQLETGYRTGGWCVYVIMGNDTVPTKPHGDEEGARLVHSLCSHPPSQRETFLSVDDWKTEQPVLPKCK